MHIRLGGDKRRFSFPLGDIHKLPLEGNDFLSLCFAQSGPGDSLQKKMDIHTYRAVVACSKVGSRHNWTRDTVATRVEKKIIL